MDFADSGGPENSSLVGGVLFKSLWSRMKRSKEAKRRQGTREGKGQLCFPSFSSFCPSSQLQRRGKPKTHVNSLLSTGLLHNSDGSVGDQDEEDNDGLDEGCRKVLSGFEEGEDERYDGTSEEDENKLVLELGEDELEDGGGFLFGESWWKKRREGAGGKERACQLRGRAEGS